jgi:phosphomethylpyrimidine synthase
MEWDNRIATSRKKRDWEKQIKLALDPELARKMRQESKPRVSDVCSMCGEYCALKIVEKALKSGRT